MALQEGHGKTNETINSFFCGPAALQRNGVIMGWGGGGGGSRSWGQQGVRDGGDGWCVQQGTWMELVMML